MKNLITLLFVLLFAGTVDAQTTRWAIDIGDSSDITWPNVICSDNNNVYVAGYYRTNLTICDSSLPATLQLTMPQMNCNMFIAKFDSSGACKWTVPGIAISNFPPAVPGFSSIKYDGMGNLYISGGFTDTMIYGHDTVSNRACRMGYYNVPYVMKVDTNGHVLWTKAFDGSLGSMEQISYMILANGNVYVTGTYQDTISMDGVVLAGPTHYSYQGFIAEISSSGHCLWIKNVAGAGVLENMDGITTDGQNIYVMGNFADSLVFPSRTIYQPSYYSSFIAKYDSGGNFRWVYGGSPQITRYLIYGNIKSDNAGHIYVSGDFIDSTRIGSTSMVTPYRVATCLARFDTAGNLNWVFSPGFKEGYYGATLTCPDQRGFYYYTTYQDSAHLGSSTFVSSGMDDFLLARYDSSGHVVWAKSLGGARHENAVDIINNNGVIYYAGFTYSSYLVDGYPIVNHGYMDVLLSRMFDSASYVPLEAPGVPATASETILYPNPTNGMLTLQSPGGGGMIKVFSITGQLVHEQAVMGRNTTINLSDLSSGIYLLKAISPLGAVTFKVIKQ